MLEEKIKKSLDLIRKAEKLALKMQPSMGFYVGFSGGKDSQVLLELTKMAGVKYQAYYNVTTNDPADNVRFIRRYYPSVKFSVPKESYFSMIAKWGMPTRVHRWCCALYKESEGVGCVVLTGVRREESRKRAEYEEVERRSRQKEDRDVIDLEVMEDSELGCVNGEDKIMVYPLLEWSEVDVWNFISMQGLPINPCYDIRNRVGCVFCPYSKVRDIREYCASHPKLKESLYHAIGRYIEKRGEEYKLRTADDYFEWWLSNDTIDVYIAKKRQLVIDF